MSHKHFSLKLICSLYIEGVKKERVAEIRVSLPLTLAECVLSGSILCGENKVLDKHSEFRPVVSRLGSKDACEGRGCSSGGSAGTRFGCRDSVACLLLGNALLGDHRFPLSLALLAGCSAGRISAGALQGSGVLGDGC